MGRLPYSDALRRPVQDRRLRCRPSHDGSFGILAIAASGHKRTESKKLKTLTKSKLSQVVAASTSPTDLAGKFQKLTDGYNVES